MFLDIDSPPSSVRVLQRRHMHSAPSCIVRQKHIFIRSAISSADTDLLFCREHLEIGPEVTVVVLPGFASHLVTESHGSWSSSLVYKESAFWRVVFILMSYFNEACHSAYKHDEVRVVHPWFCERFRADFRTWCDLRPQPDLVRVVQLNAFQWEAGWGESCRRLASHSQQDQREYENWEENPIHFYALP